MNRVLFLCSGNYYRSRFAEILFNWQAERRGDPWRAESRGLAIDPRNPGPISLHTLHQLRQRGIASSACERFPQDACDADFAAAQIVIAVKEAEHRPLVEKRFSPWRAKVEYWNVHDLDCAEPCVAIPGLESNVISLLTRLGTTNWLNGYQPGGFVCTRPAAT